MTVSVAHCEVQGSTVILRGELDIATVDELERALAEALRDPSASAVVVDLSAATFFDSATITALMRARASAAAEGRRLGLRGLKPRLHRVLGLFAPEPPFELMGAASTG